MLDELLFHLGRRALRGVRGEECPAGRVRLAEQRGRLQVLASTLCGANMQVSAAAGGPGGVVGAHIYLPAELALFDRPERNAELYVLRLILGLSLQEVARRRGLLAGARLDPDQRVLASVWLAEDACARAVAAYPGLAAALARARELLGAQSWWDAPPAGMHDPERLREVLVLRCRELCLTQGRRRRMFGPRHLPLPDALLLTGLVCNPPAGAGVFEPEPDSPEQRAGALPRGSQREGKSQEEVEVLEEAEDPGQQNPVLHLFEKIETAEEYQGTKRLRDGSDELDEHADALDELQLGHVIRTRQTSESLYQADLAIEAGEGMGDAALPDEGAVFYDEWDGRRRRYRERHCRVYPGEVAKPCAAETLAARVGPLRKRLRRPMQELRATLLSLAQAERLRSGQRDGPELDLDAFVDSYGRRAAGGQAAERIWWARRPRRRELAVLLLIDASLSADSWVQNRRVLDVEREAAFMLGEVLGGQGMACAIAAFHSFTRHDCRYLQIKDFGASFATALPALFGLRPDGYTRIGPALRHATAELCRQRAQRRLLLVLTDGKATDQDAYEGRLGTEDVRQAVREAEQRGVDCLALAVEKDARHYLPRSFGRRGFVVMPRPEVLPEQLAVLLERVCAS